MLTRLLTVPFRGKKNSEILSRGHTSRFRFTIAVDMHIVEHRGSAVALMLESLLLLGTWPALLTLLERRGRLPQHTYLNYSVSNLLAAVVIAITFGQVGGSRPAMPNFFTQLTQVLCIVASKDLVDVNKTIFSYRFVDK